MILSICAKQIDEYSFSVWNTVPSQTYISSGIDLYNNVTAATLRFNKVNGDASEEVSYTMTVAEFKYLFHDGGFTISFSDFGEDTIFGETFWPDWMYQICIDYTYQSIEYTACTTVGFLKIIRNIVYQQLLKANWKKELSCSCGCDPYNSTLRKWDYLRQLTMAAELCLISEWESILLALYKLTGTEHEFE